MSRPGRPDWEPGPPVKIKHTVHWRRIMQLALGLAVLGVLAAVWYKALR
jgi:hypothetical protein